jgi:hypothetical protein
LSDVIETCCQPVGLCEPATAPSVARALDAIVTGASLRKSWFPISMS